MVQLHCCAPRCPSSSSWVRLAAAAEAASPLLVILQEGSGKISLRKLQAYASKHGGETLTLEDLKGEWCTGTY